MSDEVIILDTPEQIANYRLLVLYHRLKLEVGIGMEFRVSTLAAVKKEFGLKGTKKKVLEQYEEILKERGLLA